MRVFKTENARFIDLNAHPGENQPVRIALVDGLMPGKLLTTVQDEGCAIARIGSVDEQRLL
ncbi:hypothetical protein [Xanthomonas campestris]|uniref:hypothetical protein n=1 Tax=Xanthomonas campestris TaxID=339 RepID=UPI001115A148|nr:hypothetical protein [Xanthomonas campestris]WDK02007.1 hypothetical protein JH273_20005 [Xanthomonas campestris]WHO91289.1 hypothetical protein QMY62_13245 [Xanthomonas campestris]WVL59325.1 hypothetical protein LLE68_013420 [Xanthomonas campestris pv. barbareae]